MVATSSPRRRVRIARILLILYIVVLALIAWWPTPVDQDARPFLRILLRHLPLLSYERIEFTANILLFLPLGLLLAVILDRSRYLVLPIALVATVTIECTQAALLSQRTPSVLDIVANTTGAAVGLIIVGIVDARRRGPVHVPPA